jgi:hypothetical protein
MNRLHRREGEEDSRLEARVASFDPAFRMQVEAPEAFDLEGESEAIRRASTGSTRSTPAPSANSASWRACW